MKPTIVPKSPSSALNDNIVFVLGAGVDILGYSFGIADEHFNDLIRKGNVTAKLIVVNPDMDGTATRLCQRLRQDRAILRLAEVRGLETLSGGRLTFVKAKAEEIDRLRLAELLR